MANKSTHAPVSSDQNAVQALYLVSQATRADSAAPRFKARELPRDLRYLQVGLGGQPELAEPAARRATGIAVEVVDAGLQPALLTLQLTPDAGSLRVNGHPTTRLSVLRSGDQILIDGHLLYLATFCRPPIALATDQQIGKDCPLCRKPVAKGDQVYVCPCGWGPVHWLSVVEPNGEQPLECVTLLHQCTACKRSLVFEERWEHAPGDD